LALKELQKY